jgi:hypothetical protein
MRVDNGRVSLAAHEPRVDVLRAEQAQIAHHRDRVVGEYQQWCIDTEVRATRRALLTAARERTVLSRAGFLDRDFLLVADRSTLHQAIVETAVGVQGVIAADLQVYDRDSRTLRIADQRGFKGAFLAHFAEVEAATPSACAVAMTRRSPVIVFDVLRSPIFAGRPSADVLLAAGSRAVSSYPLLTADGAVAGVLSFHYAKPTGRRDHAAFVARCVTAAIGFRPLDATPEDALPLVK